MYETFVPPRILWIAILNFSVSKLAQICQFSLQTGMTFNLESFAYHFSMLKSERSHWSRSVKLVVNGYLCVTAARLPSVVTQRPGTKKAIAEI